MALQEDPPRSSENTHLWDCSQEFLYATEAVSLGLHCFSDILGIGHGKLMKKKLLVVVSTKQRPHILGKQIQTCELHTLLRLIISENLVQEKDAALDTPRKAAPNPRSEGLQLRVTRYQTNLKMESRRDSFKDLLPEKAGALSKSSPICKSKRAEGDKPGVSNKKAGTKGGRQTLGQRELYQAWG